MFSLPISTKFKYFEPCLISYEMKFQSKPFAQQVNESESLAFIEEKESTYINPDADRDKKLIYF